MMGDGFVIELIEGMFVLLINGEVMIVFLIKYVIGLKIVEGIEIFIYVGLDIVNLKGEGFEVFVWEGDSV